MAEQILDKIVAKLEEIAHKTDAHDSAISTILEQIKNGATLSSGGMLDSIYDIIEVTNTFDSKYRTETEKERRKFILYFITGIIFAFINMSWILYISLPDVDSSIKLWQIIIKWFIGVLLQMPLAYVVYLIKSLFPNLMTDEQKLDRIKKWINSINRDFN